MPTENQNNSRFTIRFWVLCWYSADGLPDWSHLKPHCNIFRYISWLISNHVPRNWCVPEDYIVNKSTSRSGTDQSIIASPGANTAMPKCTLICHFYQIAKSMCRVNRVVSVNSSVVADPSGSTVVTSGAMANASHHSYKSTTHFYDSNWIIILVYNKTPRHNFIWIFTSASCQPWASCQLRKIAGACVGNTGNVFPTTAG